ncbi:enoyl-CoA hydratase/isomerase family protein [Halomonas sp. G11]|uniref:enoyl-CoA hydratase/isomerase family protein n=1 Tax=Halomonas sp. G11 TaxID=1684425 RepID=UPI000801320B|nr:enoyl-CoA hydratase-related protein [Halomonas sp. G11]OAZ96106.1 crotonase [Halomonas sp. G11]
MTTPEVLPSYSHLIVTQQDHVLTVCLNRPDRLNAVVEALYQELLDVLAIAQRERDMRAVVITGEGRAFCVGADMKAHEGAGRTLFQRRQYLQLGNDVGEAIAQLSKPVIAAVNGYALGAGAEMAVACDFVLMADDAQIGFPETSIGTSVGGGVSKWLPQLVGLAQARRLLYTGENINGAEATRLGLALANYPLDQLMPEAGSLASQLAGKAPVSLAMLKPLVNRAAQTDMPSQLQQELDAVFTCSTTEDWQEGVNAFAEKRAPQFKGR